MRPGSRAGGGAKEALGGRGGLVEDEGRGGDLGREDLWQLLPGEGLWKMTDD